MPHKRETLRREAVLREKTGSEQHSRADQLYNAGMAHLEAEAPIHRLRICWHTHSFNTWEQDSTCSRQLANCSRFPMSKRMSIRSNEETLRHSFRRLLKYDFANRTND
jgi:hypothetical protein